MSECVLRVSVCMYAYARVFPVEVELLRIVAKFLL
jgi:hypothetical protein